MKRPYNFSAGPAMLPEEVLIQVQQELLNWQNTGASILEIGHRTPAFQNLLEEAALQLRALLHIPAHYRILFLGQPTRLQFSNIPINFLAHEKKAAYLITGLWSATAYIEANRLRQAYVVASGEERQFTTIPLEADWKWEKNTGYFYYTPNETVNGIRCDLPSLQAEIPVVADMTSCLLSEVIDIEKYALIFAGAQKNIANAGLTILIIREDFLQILPQQLIPATLDFRIQAKYHSLYATPPTFNCYMALKMFEWIQQQGGVAALSEKNNMKARLLYDYLDTSSFYIVKVEKPYRSIMNICFFLKNQKLEPLFLEEAQKNKLLALQGHRSVGGLRASLYNAMPIEGVECLIQFMDYFAKEYAYEALQ